MMRRLPAAVACAVILIACTVLFTACGAQPASEEIGLEAAPDGTRLVCLNVGKADCLLLFLEDKTYLIDAGWERRYGALREALQQYGVRRLNGVILTHCHEDHFGGLMYLTQNDIAVDAWYASPEFFNVKASKHPLAQAASTRGEDVTWLKAGDVLTVSESASITVLGPLRLSTDNENNNSMVLYVRAPEGELLLAGDMKSEEENELLASHAIERAAVLKVGHHGDNGATGDALIQAVSPEVAVISTSTREELDTPSSAVIKRLQRAGAQVAVTQDFSDGILVSFRNGKPVVSDIDWGLPDYSKDISLKLTLSEDLLTLRNASGASVALAGWIVYSSRGEDCYMLPEDAVLPANGVYKLGTGVTQVKCDAVLDDGRVWNDTRYDQAALYDGAGHLVAVTDNALPE